MKLGLERIETVLKNLNIYQPNYKIIQVVGTNGKGSSSSFISFLSQYNGYKTGLYTSPHFISVRERILIDSKPLPEELWLEYANIIIDAGGEVLTYFEFITVLAVLAFSKNKVQVGVFEAGLGGLNDATSVLDADLHLFTPIALDHKAIIGPELKNIAEDKSGAISARSIVVSTTQKVEVENILSKAAQEKNALFIKLDKKQFSLPEEFLTGAKQLGLLGKHQQENALLALTGWRLFAEKHAFNNDEKMNIKALEKTFIAGRLQRVQLNRAGKPHFFLLDAAHNPHGMATLGKSLGEAGVRPSACVFTCMSDKDINGLVANLRVLCPAPVFIPELFNNPRSVAASVLAEKIGMAAMAVKNFEEALNKACEFAEKEELNIETQPILICGSLYLLAEFFTVYPEYLIKD
ncbi:bifunctional folylpolyglutamate synthase/dihydrofolate synthase [Desulfovibrio litoralis]|nr:cyanophycin synthetase [Desulfovibrio litoralis]